MLTSLSDLCARTNGITSLVMQGDRRQVADRRKTRRGGRRADDANPAVDPLDMRSVAIRRALTHSQLPSNSVDAASHADARYSAVVTRVPDPATRRFAMAAGRRTPPK